MTSTSEYTFTDLNELLGKAVGKIGLENAIRLLKEITSEAKIDVDHHENIKLITFFLISRCASAFNLREDDFLTCPIREYRDGRMACYHLLRKYTGSSYPLIAQQFQTKKRNVLYSCQKCEELLSVPQFHRDFTAKYNTLENLTIEFIAKLNASKKP